MADQEDDIDMRAENLEELEDLERQVKRGNRLIAMMANQCRKKITDRREAAAFQSAIEALAKDQEDVMRCLNHLREVQDAEEDIEALRKAVKEIKAGSLVFFYLPEVPKEDQGEDGGSAGKKISFARRWLKEKLSSGFGESSSEGTADLVGQLREKSTELEANLYFLLAQFASLTPESNKEVAHYAKFMSSLDRLAKDSDNEIARGILDFMNGFPWQAGSGSLEGKADKGRRIDSLLDKFLKNIQRVTSLIVQVSSSAGRIQECEAEQNDIHSKINALKEMD